MKIRKSNYILTIITTSLVLLFLGLYGLILMHSHKFVDVVREKVNIMVELEDDLTEEKRSEIQQFLEESEEVKSSSVRFVSKEEGLELLKEDLDLEFISAANENPLSDIFQFNVEASVLNAKDLENLSAEIQSLEGVYKVIYHNEFYSLLASRIRSFSNIFFVISFIFLIISVVLIHNIFYLRLQADRVKIRTMQYVGAEWNFIKKPYIKESYKVALTSWILSVGIMVILLILIIMLYPVSKDYISWLQLGLNFLGILVISFLICSLSARFIIDSYLKRDIDQLS